MITGKNIAIVGIGREGVSSANYLGRDNNIWLVDQKKESEIPKDMLRLLQIKPKGLYFKNEQPKTVIDFVVRSPGVRTDNIAVRKLTENGARVTSQVKIFFDQFKGTTIGVTGTKGKGTTSTLIYEILKESGNHVVLAGNIGVPPLDILDKVDENSTVVLELSSFQLIDLEKSPHIAVVLMITSEHLDWHPNSQAYRQAKQSIVKYQTKDDFAVINKDFSGSSSFANFTKAKVYFVSQKEETNGLFIKENKIFSKINKSKELIDTNEIVLPGRHNLQNIMAAASVAQILNMDNDITRKVIKSFKGLKHRLQIVNEINGVLFINDSISTTPETVMAAIDAFSRPKILILGGSSKNSSFKSLAVKIHQDKTIKAIVFIGKEGTRIKAEIEKAGGFMGKYLEGAASMNDATTKSKEEAVAGDVVILSPACASFDMFKNYEDRGNQFMMEIAKLKNAKDRGSS